jgi:hypothetical protein
MRLFKISEMEENAYQLFQHELEVHQVMRVHCEEGVFPSIYPCSEFINAAGILQDFQTLVSNAGVEHFIDGEPHQYAKLTISGAGFFKEENSQRRVVKFRVFISYLFDILPTLLPSVFLLERLQASYPLMI